MRPGISSLLIPDYWGIGKSVSRGFGTVVRQRTDGRLSEDR